MVADSVQPLKMQRLIALLDSLIGQTDQSHQEEEQDLRGVDFTDVDVLAGYLRDIGLDADAQRIHDEFTELFICETDVVLLDLAKSDPESEDFLRETFGIPPLESDADSHDAAQATRKFERLGRAAHVRDRLKELRRLLTEAQTTDDGANVNSPTVAAPLDSLTNHSNTPTSREPVVDDSGNDDLEQTLSTALCDISSNGGQQPPTSVAGEDAEIQQYVKLDQMAAIVNRSKKTLERLKTNAKLPLPDVHGGGGKPDEWLWSNVREVLVKEFGKLLPERFPSQRKPLADTDRH